MNEEQFSDCASTLQSRNDAADWVPLAPGCGLLLPGWLGAGESQRLLWDCLEQLHWERPSVRLFGKEHRIPRRHAFVGDAKVSYRWSGLEQRPQPWPPSLAEVRARLAAAGFHFNSLLVNHYRDGGDGMGWHADNEKELGDWPVVATISLGQVRRLAFKRRDGSARLALEMSTGSLLLTSGAVQHHWLHRVPKSRKPLEERISLTFRHIKY